MGISKRAWISAYLKLPEDDPAVNIFSSFGHHIIPSEMENDALPQPVDALETFAFRMYCANGPTVISALRWEMLRSKNMEGEMLPPTRSALLPHAMRANYMSMRDKSYIRRFSSLPRVEESGWILEKGL